MANIQIKDLPPITDPADGDVFHVNELATGADKKLTSANLYTDIVSTKKANNTQAIAGTDDTLLMTPAKTKLHLDERLQESFTDGTLGSIMTVGAFGLGLEVAPVGDMNTTLSNGFYRYIPDDPNIPVAGAGGAYIVAVNSTTGVHQIAFVNASPRLYTRRYNGSTWSEWEIFYTSGNPNTDTLYETGSKTLTREAPKTEIDMRTSSGSRTLTLATSGWVAGDMVTIHKSVLLNTLTITTTQNVIDTSNSSIGTSQTIPEGVAMTVTLTYTTTNNWSLSVQG